MSDNFWNQLER